MTSADCCEEQALEVEQDIVLWCRKPWLLGNGKHSREVGNDLLTVLWALESDEKCNNEVSSIGVVATCKVSKRKLTA